MCDGNGLSGRQCVARNHEPVVDGGAVTRLSFSNHVFVMRDLPRKAEKQVQHFSAVLTIELTQVFSHGDLNRYVSLPRLILVQPLSL